MNNVQLPGVRLFRVNDYVTVRIPNTDIKLTGQITGVAMIHIINTYIVSLDAPLDAERFPDCAGWRTMIATPDMLTLREVKPTSSCKHDHRGCVCEGL